MSGLVIEVPARPATEAEIPRGARNLIALAQRSGCRVRVTYSRGPDSIGRRIPRMVDAVVMHVVSRCGRRAVACWTDGSMVSAFVHRPEVTAGPTWQRVKVAELRTWMAES